MIYVNTELLEKLDISETNIRDYNFIRRFKKLKEITISKNSITMKKMKSIPKEITVILR